mgnify:CR=1 FL=1
MVVFSKGTGGFLNPEEIVNEFGLKNGMSVADFGCGHGYFAFPIAKRIQPDGQVIALDILESALDSIESRKKLEGLFNIVTKRCDLERGNGSGLKEESQDLVLVTNLLFQVDNEENIIKEAKRILKPGGTLIIIDWLENSNVGPVGRRVPKEVAKNLAEKFGFSFEKEIKTGDYHYGLIFKK